MGLWLMLRAVGMLTADPEHCARRRPAPPLIVGMAILIRSPRPRSASRRVCGPDCCLLRGVRDRPSLDSHLRLAIRRQRGLDGERGWYWHTWRPAPSPSRGTGPSQRVVVAFRLGGARYRRGQPTSRGYRYTCSVGASNWTPESACPEGWSPDEAVMIEITVCLGNVTVVRHPKSAASIITRHSLCDSDDLSAVGRSTMKTRIRHRRWSLGTQGLLRWRSVPQGAKILWWFLPVTSRSC